VLDAFAADARLGLVAVHAHYPPLAEAWGGNVDTLLALAVRLGIRMPHPTRDRFPAGTMFWARLDALAPLLDAHLDEADFETESGQIDGTLAHAVERMVGVCVEAAGFRVDACIGRR
jgi:lipopolysaccharide biosynthesis protein